MGEQRSGLGGNGTRVKLKSRKRRESCGDVDCEHQPARRKSFPLEHTFTMVHTETTLSTVLHSIVSHGNECQNQM